MPTYDYKCSDCGHEFEVFQSIKDNPVKVCPVCNAGVQRIIHGGTGMKFKGAGFYINDYKNNSSDNGKKESSTPSDSPKSDRTDSSKNGKDGSSKHDPKPSKDT